MIGLENYREMNGAFEELLASGQPLIAVHRGSSRGTIAQNTLKAIRAAEVEGADIVEIDIARSTDGDFFIFHDGYEPLHFGVRDNIRDMSTAQIEKLGYRWCSDDVNKYPVERLRTVLEKCPDTFFNIDRSWWWWPAVLDEMAEHGNPDHLLVKSPVTDEALAALSAHEVKFPYVPVVSSIDDVERVWADERINLMGVELVTDDPNHPFCDPQYIYELKARGLAVMVDAINLEDGIARYAGFDDEVSVLDDPERGWGQIVSRGVDVIMTDWPGVLRRFLVSKLRRLP